MATTETARRTIPGEEVAQRGNEICDRLIKPIAEPGQLEQFVAIDVLSEDFEIDPDDAEATERLIARRPDALIWARRVGRDYIGRL